MEWDWCVFRCCGLLSSSKKHILIFVLPERSILLVIYSRLTFSKLQCFSFSSGVWSMVALFMGKLYLLAASPSDPLCDWSLDLGQVSDFVGFSQKPCKKLWIFAGLLQNNVLSTAGWGSPTVTVGVTALSSACVQHGYVISHNITICFNQSKHPSCVTIRISSILMSKLVSFYLFALDLYIIWVLAASDVTFMSMKD